MIDEYIAFIWLYVSILLILISIIYSLIKSNKKFFITVSSIIVFIYLILTSLRSKNYNSDTLDYFRNYFIPYDTFSNLYNLFIEPGFKLSIWLLRQLGNEYFVLIVLSLIPGLIFFREFVKRSYHPILILLLFTSFFLLEPLLLFRQFLAMSFLFVLVNKIVYNERIKLIYWILPILFHLSTLPIILFLYVLKYKNYFLLLILIILFSPLALFVYKKMLWYISIQGQFGISRLIEGILIIVISFFYVDKYKIKFFKDKIFFLYFFFVILITLFPMLMRVMHYLILIAIVYLSYYYKYIKHFKFNYFILYILSILQVYYYVVSNNSNYHLNWEVFL